MVRRSTSRFINVVSTSWSKPFASLQVKIKSRNSKPAFSCLFQRKLCVSYPLNFSVWRLDEINAGNGSK